MLCYCFTINKDVEPTDNSTPSISHGTHDTMLNVRMFSNVGDNKMLMLPDCESNNLNKTKQSFD